MDDLNTKYLTDTDGMPHWVVEAMDALLPILPGNPAWYVDLRGRIDLTRVQAGYTPHSHATQKAADLVVELWNGWSRNSLLGLLKHADGGNRAHVARALRAIADGISPRVDV